MPERISENQAILAEIRRLRRFATTLTSDQSAADSAVLAAISEKKELLSAPRDFGRIYHSLLRNVYQTLYDQSDRRRKLSLMKPAESLEIAAPVKLQSLDFDDRAVVSLMLIEELSFEEIASILDQPADQVEEIATKSVQFLSRHDDSSVPSGKGMAKRQVSI